MQKSIPEQRIGLFHQLPITISYETNLAKLQAKFPEQDLGIFLQIYDLAHLHPKTVLKDLLLLNAKYPHNPEISNVLTFLYLRLKKVKAGEKLIKENYQHNPSNIFAKINFADKCLREKKLDKIAQIFEYSFDLQKLYPNQKLFHVSEYRGFHTTLGFYFLARKNFESATYHHYLAHSVDPRHPSVILLGRKLHYQSPWKRFLGRFQRKRVKPSPSCPLNLA